MFMDSHGVFVKVRIFERVVGEVDLAWAVAPAPRDPIWWGQQKQNNLHMFCLPAIHFGSSGHGSLFEPGREFFSPPSTSLQDLSPGVMAGAKPWPSLGGPGTTVPVCRLISRCRRWLTPAALVGVP